MEEKLADREKIKRRLTGVKVGREVSARVPKVSIIIPAYDSAEFIAETLDSVFAQSYEDFEVVIVNDGSNDTAELGLALAPYAERIVYAEQKNSGASETRNAAICLARGEMLAFLDGDDVWLPDFLGSQINFLEENNFEMVYADAELFGERLFAGKTFMQTAPSVGEFTTEKLLDGNCNVITSGTLLKRELLEKFGLFDADAVRVEDFDLWFRLAKRGAKIGYQRKVLLKYRVRPGSLSGSNIERRRRSIFAFETIERKYELTVAETEILQNRTRALQAELDLETGKFHLTQRNFSEAKTHLVKANKFYRQRNLSIIAWLLRVSPKLTRMLFKKLRPAEFSFIAGGKS